MAKTIKEKIASAKSKPSSLKSTKEIEVVSRGSLNKANKIIVEQAEKAKASKRNTQDDNFGKDRLGVAGMKKDYNSNNKIKQDFKGGSPLALENSQLFSKYESLFTSTISRSRQSANVSTFGILIGALIFFFSLQYNIYLSLVLYPFKRLLSCLYCC